MEFDKDTYKVCKLPHPLLLHWIINPGLAFNELILGQRVPKITLIDKTSDAPVMERQYVPCPHCKAINDARLWSKNNSFGHWFGYVCPKCHGKIPCLWNLTSLLLLAATFPIWIWIKILGESKWLEREKNRLSRVMISGLPEAQNTSWLKMGLAFGALMFSMMVIPKAFQNQLDAIDIAVHAIIWLGAGLAFGGLMKLVVGSGK